MPVELDATGTGPQPAEGQSMFGRDQALFLQAPTKPKAGDIGSVSMELRDILQLCTHAHRHKHGNVVWLGWIAGKDKKTYIHHGAHCIAVSHQGALTLERNKQAVIYGKLEQCFFVSFCLKNICKLPAPKVYRGYWSWPLGCRTVEVAECWQQC